jgi:hypothetical protein
MFPEQIAYLGVLISLTGQLFYLRGIIFGSVRPNLVSHTIWMSAPFIGVFFQLKAGAGLSALIIFMAGFTSLLIIIVSILKKNGYWKLNNFDLLCGLFSVLALILYVSTHNLGISILFAIIADALAYIPTIIKTWSFPETESWTIYAGGIASNIIGLLTIKNWIFTIYSFGFSIILFNTIVLFAIYRRKIFKTQELVH